MDKKQAREMIQDLFSHAFDRERYTLFLANLLNSVELREGHYTGQLVPEAYRDHVNQYWRIGKYSDPEGEDIDLLVVEVKSLHKLERARSALRNFAINRLKQFEKEASLIAFYAKDDGGSDWRFSFVKIEHEAFRDEKGKVKLKQELTPAKRYSYLVGEHENSHTACKQLLPLLEMDYANPRLEDIEKAFSIEKVTKEFFEQYKGLFQTLSKTLSEQPYFQQEDAEKQDLHVSKFAKKLLGQIVFLYFLQKKGWMGVPKDEAWGKGERRFLQALFAGADAAGQNYYVEKLQFLFYEALANDRKDQFDPSYYQRFDCRIPFLNGGLFEADYDWQKIRVEIPNKVFSNKEKGEGGDTGTGILDVFDRYNFTIKEDEPLDKEVAVDPEMLGKVFENMLEITERKSKGAFYTPREIVHYMCQESLIHYLCNECGSTVSVEEHANPENGKSHKRDACATAIPKADIETLVRKGVFAAENDQTTLDKGRETETYKFKLPESIRKHAALIDDKLADIKICDPAIGSGAFPVGMLHEIVNARLALSGHLPEARRIRQYDLKKHTIAHSIYGVDLDPSAIDIARLRLWLSLVVDEDDYTSIDALPNLDYKIMQGNSLIEEYEGVKLFDGAFIQEEPDHTQEIQKLKQEETDISREYIALSQQEKLSKDQKNAFDQRLRKLSSQIKALQNPVQKEQDPELFAFLGEARKKAELLEELHQKFFDVSSPAEKRQLRDRITTLEWELIEATLAEQNKTDALAKLEAYKTSGEKPWFLWKLNFSEVFRQKGGFDIVIGNPPYGASLSEIEKNVLKQHYAHLVERIRNSFLYFTGLGDEVSNISGTVSFIIPNEFLFQIYMSKARAFFLRERRMLNVINVGESAFEAIVPTCIILFGKRNADQNYTFKGFDFRDHDLVSAMKMIYGNEISSLQRDSILNANKSIYSFDTELAAIAERITMAAPPLADLCEDVANGISTSCDSVYVIEHADAEYLNLSKEPLLEPTLKGGDFKKFRCPRESGKSILYIDKHVHLDQYPESFKYLLRHKELLVSKSVEKKQGKRDWHLLFRARSRDLFTPPKILARQTGDSVITAVDNVGYYCIDSVNVISLKNVYKNRCFTVAAILNSCVCNFFYRQISQEAGRVLAQVKPSRLRAIPIKLPAGDHLGELYRYVNETESRSLVGTYFEQLIDGLVYELYFPDEIKAAGKAILPHLGELTPLTDAMRDEEKLAIIQREFDRLYDPSHPVRNRLETLDSVDVVRTIRESLKR